MHKLLNFGEIRWRSDMRSRYSRSRCEIICNTKTFSLLQFPNSKKNSRAKEKKVLRLGIPNVYIVTFFFRTLLVTLRIAWNKIFLSFSKDLDLFLQTFLQILKDFLKRFFIYPNLSRSDFRSDQNFFSIFCK